MEEWCHLRPCILFKVFRRMQLLYSDILMTVKHSLLHHICLHLDLSLRLDSSAS